MDEPETMIIEINLISSKGLKILPSAVMRRMHTYALTWVSLDAKLYSDLDYVDDENPTKSSSSDFLRISLKATPSPPNSISMSLDTYETTLWAPFIKQ